MMKGYKLAFLIMYLAIACRSQVGADKERVVGGPCGDCEALMDYQLVADKLTSTDTLPGFAENEPKVRVTGTVFKRDGKTPAKGIIVYVYHVDRKGIYQPSDEPVGWEHRHGQHRGWMKTNDNGEFTFYTFRPAHYPDMQEPAHIHIYVKEPETIPYYLDNYVFEGDPLLDERAGNSASKRGGGGMVTLMEENGLLTARRNIVLGLNITGYE